MLKIVLLIIILFLASLFTGGCATPPRFNTQSGKPEITLYSNDRDKVKAVIINEFMNSGFTLVSESDNLLLFSKRM